jgi:lipopolysaccharide export system protein LptA
MMSRLVLVALAFFWGTLFSALTAATVPTPSVAQSSAQAAHEIDLPAPVGEEMKGITIPQYEVDGKLKMKLSCETAQKIDEHNVTIHGLKVEFFEQDGKDVTVTVPQARFNLVETLLSTETTTTIKREDFTMVGEAGTFDTTKRSGTMKRHVHTEIRNGAPPQADLSSTKAQDTTKEHDQLSTSSSSPWDLHFGHQPRPQEARTVIDAQDGAWFDDGTNTVEFFGRVVVHDPQFTLLCDRLNVMMNKNRQGLQLVTASGNVHIEQQGEGNTGERVKSTGKAEVAIYEPLTGDIMLKGWPQVRQGKNFQVATEEGTIMVLNNRGTFHTTGQTRTTILDTGEQEKK